MSNTWKLSEATMQLKKGKYVVLYDPEDPRNGQDPKDGKHIICIVSASDAMTDEDFQNAAILKSSKSLLKTLLEIKETLSKRKRGGFDAVLSRDVINKINTTLNSISKK